MGAEEIEQALGLTTLEKAVRWAQTKSMWPDTFGLACCAIEMMSIVSSRYDIARFGMEAFRSSPRQADLLIVSGRVAHKMAAPIRQIYDQMLEPKWVIAMGACASSGGMFNNYTILQGVDRILPVDIYVPFCPPRPEALMEGIIRLHEAHLAGVAARVRAPRGRDVSYARAARLRRARRRRSARRPSRSSRRASATPARTRATSSASRCSSTSSRPTTWAGAARASPATSRPRAGATSTIPSTQGFQTLPAAEAEALLRRYHLLALRQPPVRVRLQVLARRRRGGAERRLGLADRRLARARAVRPDGHPLRRSPEPEAPAHGRRLGRAPAAQGLSASAASPSASRTPNDDRAGETRTRAWPIVNGAQYEGSRIPSPVPTIARVLPESLQTSDDVLRINFGPNHPSTHGVLRLIVDLDGEQVVGLDAVIGYLHTGFEKTMEHEDVVEVRHVSGAHRLRRLPEQRAHVRARGREAARRSRCRRRRPGCARCSASSTASTRTSIFLGTSALELGAVSMFWYCFREREMILDLFEMVTGQRMHTRYFQVGGLAEDIPKGFYPECRKFVEWMPNALNDYLTLLDRNAIWLERTKGVGVLSADDAIALGQTGPNLRASGVDWDLRRDQPYLAYDQRRLPACRCTRTATSTTATACAWTRCASRRASSTSACAASSAWRGGRGSPTTARSCCRRARSCTPRWSRSSTTSRSSPRASASPRARSTSRSSRRAASRAATSCPRAARSRGACTSARRRSSRSRRRRRACTTTLVADLIAIVGSLDAVMGDTDR